LDRGESRTLRALKMNFARLRHSSKPMVDSCSWLTCDCADVRKYAKRYMHDVENRTQRSDTKGVKNRNSLELTDFTKWRPDYPRWCSRQHDGMWRYFDQSSRHVQNTGSACQPRPQCSLRRVSSATFVSTHETIQVIIMINEPFGMPLRTAGRLA
jgi:hypothetical protein